MKKIKKLWLGLLPVMLCILSACMQSGGSGQVPVGSNNGISGIAMPIGVVMLPDPTALTATLVCPDNKKVTLTIKNNSALGSCVGLTPGKGEKFTIHWYYGKNNIEIANAIKTMDVVAGSNPALTYAAKNYNENIDNDGDGFTNISEIANGTDPNAFNYHIGGTVTGLQSNNQIVLQDNGGNNLSLGADGTFSFTAGPPTGGSYTVTVLTQPIGAVCSVSSGSGNVSNADISNISVTCVPAYSIGGTISGLTGTLVLQNNGGGDLTQTGNGSFTFPTPVAAGGAYGITILTQPNGQNCIVTNGSGSNVAGNVANVSISCASRTWDHIRWDIDNWY